MIAITSITLPQNNRTVGTRTQIPNRSPRVRINARSRIGVTSQKLLDVCEAGRVVEVVISLGKMISIPVQCLFKTRTLL